MKTLKTILCAALLVTGLCGCEKQLIPEINLADNLEGSWEKVYPEGVQDAGLVIWDFKAGDADPQTWILSIYVSDVFTGDSESKYIYAQHQNGYPGVGSSTPEIYLFAREHQLVLAALLDVIASRRRIGRFPVLLHKVVVKFKEVELRCGTAYTWIAVLMLLINIFRLRIPGEHIGYVDG